MTGRSYTDLLIRYVSLVDVATPHLIVLIAIANMFYLIFDDHDDDYNQRPSRIKGKIAGESN